jgi:uncharacterized cupredoxin-like copper-binding protein
MNVLRAMIVGLAVEGLMAAAPAWAGSAIDVTLWDKGASAEMATDMGMGMGDSTANHSKANMGLTLSQSEVASGEVTFRVTNGSSELVHEMIILPAPTGSRLLPYNDGNAAIDEEAAGHLGEVAELEPGKTGAVTLDLKPGTYVLACNVPGHFKNGMWAVVTVK